MRPDEIIHVSAGEAQYILEAIIQAQRVAGVLAGAGFKVEEYTYNDTGKMNRSMDSALRGGRRYLEAALGIAPQNADSVAPTTKEG